MLKLSGKILADGTYAKSVLNGQITSVCGIDSLQMGVFAGVIVGLVTAALHNRFYKQQLPAALAFFSGVRFVPIISVNRTYRCRYYLLLCMANDSEWNLCTW